MKQKLICLTFEFPFDSGHREAINNIVRDLIQEEIPVSRIRTVVSFKETTSCYNSSFKYAGYTVSILEVESKENSILVEFPKGEEEVFDIIRSIFQKEIFKFIDEYTGKVKLIGLEKREPKENDSGEPHLFEEAFNQMSRLAHDNACAKGFWDRRNRLKEFIRSNNGCEDIKETLDDLITSQCLDLLHSELGEATEAVRGRITEDDKIPSFSGLEAELADVIIRIGDTAAALNLDVGAAVVEKMKMNKSRKPMHGGKNF